MWHGYAILSQPLTVLGVERRFFLLAVTLGAAIWNAVNSLLAGGLVFVVLYGADWVAWQHGQHVVGVIRAAVRGRADAGRGGRPDGGRPQCCHGRWQRMLFVAAARDAGLVDR